ncbi:MAG: glycosyl hydrolase family 18 protein [Anaerobacillus sp.]|uniref:glycosyl hydrolase family 18 protein n=1 Tax=Anaerobacillus sp. TaxID=1872506 RepID=UPI00391C5C69
MMKFKKVIALFLTLILVLSLAPLSMVVEAKKPNQSSSLETATAAVERAELHRTWEYVNLAQKEIDSLGNGKPIRASKDDLQNRLNVVKNELVLKDSEQIKEEKPTEEEPVNEEPKKEIPQEPINEDPIEEIPVETAPSKDVQEPIYHVVKPGDTLWLISLTYGVSVAEIKELNNLTSDMIFVGQVLLIVAGSEVDEELKDEKNPVQDLMILGFYTKYWNNDLISYQSLTAKHEYLNTIATASLDVNYDGSITGFIPHEALDFSKGNDVFTYATFQNHFDPNLTRAIFTNSLLQETVISNMVSYVKEHGYKGANLNFENMYASDRSLFNRFVTEMTDAFHKEGYPVMVSVPAKTCDCPTWAWSGTFDFEFLGKSNVDYIQVMSYDQHGSWGNPGPVAGYNWMNGVLNYATAHIASNKILLGLPAYGYDWNISKNTGNRALTLKQIDQLIATHNPEIKWNSLERTPYFNYVDANGDNRTVFFENFDSLSVKTSYVNSYKLAGISMWRMGQENEMFWLAVQDGLKK